MLNRPKRQCPSNTIKENPICADQSHWRRLLFVSLACVGSLVMTISVSADHNPSTCVGLGATVGLGPFADSNATVNLIGETVVPGETIYYQAAVSQNSDSDCGFEGGQLTITLPDGTPVNVTSDGGIPLVCGSPSCSPAGVSIVFSKIVPYTVRLEDFGVDHPSVTSCPATNIQATVSYTGGTFHCDERDSCDVSASASVCNPAYAVLPVRNPKQCGFSRTRPILFGPFCNSDGTGSLLGQTVVPGETIYYQAAVSQNLDSDCGFEGGQLTIVLPDGTPENVTPDGGIPLVCGSPSCNPAGVSTVFSKIVPYTVRFEDVGINQPGVASCPATNIQATVSYTGGTFHCDADNSCNVSASASICEPVVFPGLRATILVANTTNTVCSTVLNDYSTSASGSRIGSTNPDFCYSITVTNTGTMPLLIDNVSDDVLGNLTASFPAFLPPGHAALVFAGPQSVSATVTDHLTVEAHDFVSCHDLPIEATASATATVIDPTVPQLIELVQTTRLPAFLKRALIWKLRAAQASLRRGRYNAAVKQLRAFVNQARAFQRNGRFDDATGNELIIVAQVIIESL
jgi:hypothetical protein